MKGKVQITITAVVDLDSVDAVQLLSNLEEVRDHLNEFADVETCRVSQFPSAFDFK